MGAIPIGAIRSGVQAGLTALRTVWKELPTKAKATIISGMTAAVGGAVASSLGSDPDEQMNALVTKHMSSGTPGEAVDMLAGAIAALDSSEDADKLITAVRSASPAMVPVIEAAVARASSTLNTGDRQAAATSAARGYDQMTAQIAMIRRACAALSTTNPADLRALRDVLFMDEQDFAAALERAE